MMLRFTVLMALVFATLTNAQQGDKTSSMALKIEVSDSQGNKLTGFAVSAVPKHHTPALGDDALGTMDQVDRQFAPHFLTIQKGTKVRFPNSDSIKHHVYSFSPAKRFELLLKRGTEEDPLLFEKTGIVELGCNVHDWMLGYIYVVDTPYFDYTDETGSVTLALPADEYQVSVWHPRMQEDQEIISRTLQLNSEQTLSFRLKQALLPSLDDYEQEDEFSDYD